MPTTTSADLLPTIERRTASAPNRQNPLPDLEPRTVRVVLSGGLVTGLAGDLLLREAGVGANLAIWLLIATIAMAVVLHRSLGAIPREARRLLAVALLFAALVALRASPLLVLANAGTAILALALAAASAHPGSTFDLARTRVRDVIVNLARHALTALVDAFPLLLVDTPRVIAVPHRHRYATLLVLRASAIATIVAGFGVVLLVNGDPVFARLTTRLFDVNLDVGAALWHVAATAAFAWPALGAFTGAVRPAAATSSTSDARRHLSRLDVITTLGAVNVVLALFLAVQVRVFFGGMAYVQATTGLTLAQYARSGFFTLEAIGGLALAGLLAMHALLRADSPGALRAFRLLATPLMLLVLAVLGSAVARMTLYVQQFGWSVDRLYTFTGMLWLAVAFAWLRATVLGTRPLRFVGGALASAWGLLLALNLANPAALVVEGNAGRVAELGHFDLDYPVQALGADAVPSLVHALLPGGALEGAQLATRLPSGACAALGELLRRWAPEGAPKLAGWSWADMRARDEVRAHERSLRSHYCP